jgi:hypothetical protein
MLMEAEKEFLEILEKAKSYGCTLVRTIDNINEQDVFNFEGPLQNEIKGLMEDFEERHDYEYISDLFEDKDIDELIEQSGIKVIMRGF